MQKNKSLSGLFFHFPGLIILLLSSCNSVNQDPMDVNSGPATTVEDKAIAIVNKYCNAVEAMDGNAVKPYIMDSIIWVRLSGDSVLYARSSSMCDFEKATNTKWVHEILGADSNVVSVLSKETGDFYKYLGLGTKIHIFQLHVENEKIVKRVSKLSVASRGNQDVEYPKFKRWLFSQKSISEPGLMRPDTTLIFDGKSAPKMIYWLKKWAERKVHP